VTEDTLALAFRTGLPFVGLRDYKPDPDLDRVIPPDAARGARAVPLAAEDDHVRVAVADPGTDLSSLDHYLTGRQVELALAPREEIDAILGPPPPPAEEPPQAADQPEPLMAVEPAVVGAEDPEPGVDAEPEPVGADPDSPAPFATAAGPEQLTEDQPEPLAAPVAEPGAEPLVVEAAPGAEPLVTEAEPEPLAAAEPDPVALPGDDPELAGEVPTWLEPPRRRRWRAVLAVLIVFLVLVAAAVLAIALANA
jgi:hypothetical protein